MNRFALIMVAALCMASAAVLVLEHLPLPEPMSVSELAGDPKRGAYLARLAGCITCHTAPGASPLSGGAALVSNFGSFFAPNITSDTEAGIGSWTFQQFARAVRQGVSPEGDAYYPAFPYEFYATLTDQDLADLWAAILATPAVAEHAADHEVGLPFSIRSGVKLWRAVFERRATYAPDPTRTKAWNRGKYLVWGPAHCAACHVPRNVVGGMPASQDLSGDPTMQGGGNAPPITPIALAARGYTKDGLIDALRTGVAPDGDVFGSSMAEVVHGSTKYLLRQHLADMATYLLDLGE